MKELCVWLVAIVMIAGALRYIYQIWKREISPTLSTWVIFLFGTGLSLTTYAIAEHHDFRSGILNMMDVASVAMILFATFVWGNRAVHFRPFEKWYLGGIGAIISYGFIFGDAWGSNIFAQVLIGIGYIPTAHKLFAEKKNTESFTTWSLAGVAGFLGLYPAMVDGNSLAMLYAIRTIILVSGLLALMTYYEFRSKKARSYLAQQKA